MRIRLRHAFSVASTAVVVVAATIALAPSGGVVSNCSGIGQNNWQLTSITAGFTG
jgi:hypothetical protein